LHFQGEGWQLYNQKCWGLLVQSDYVLYGYRNEWVKSCGSCYAGRQKSRSSWFTMVL